MLALAMLPLRGLVVLVGATEGVFRNKFVSRFINNTATSHIYTNEVIGNIRESYDMPLLLSLVASVSLALWWVILRRVGPLMSLPAGGLAVRSRAALIWMLAPLAAFGALDSRYKEFSSYAKLHELAD